MNDESFDSDTEPCSYCGKDVYADSPRCPSCGNFTDGLGNHGGVSRSEQRLPRLWVIVGWIVLIALLAPFFIAIHNHFKR